MLNKVLIRRDDASFNEEGLTIGTGLQRTQGIEVGHVNSQSINQQLNAFVIACGSKQ
jgi:hypothetical protein